MVSENDPQSLEFVLPSPGRTSLSEVKRLLGRPSGPRDRVPMLPSQLRDVEREEELQLLLRGSDPANRIAACDRLAEKGGKRAETVSSLARLIQRDPHPLVKAHAIHTLVRLGNAVALKVLRHDLQRLRVVGQPLGVQLEAVKAEAYIGRRGGRADEDFLMSMFDHWRTQPADEDSDLMLWAILFTHTICAWSLLHCSARYPDYVPALLALAHSQRDQYVRAAAVGVLGSPVVIPENAEACNEAIREALSDRDEAVRLAALASMGSEDTGHASSYLPEAIEQLVSVMSDPHETKTARSMAARAVAFQSSLEARNLSRLLAALNGVEERDGLFGDLAREVASTLAERMKPTRGRSDPEARERREIARQLAAFQP